DLFRTETNARRRIMDVHCPATNDKLRPAIYADPTLREHLVYNRADNAVKYGHRGTRICIDCRKESTNTRGPHVLTVTSYGREIEECSRPYELYHQGDNAGEKGLGIGLWISKQIAEAHGGSISHSRKKLSDFNVPLMSHYISRSDLEIREPNTIKAITKLLSQMDSMVYREIVAIDPKGEQKYSAPSNLEILESVFEPTWEVEFKVTIPAKEKKS
ncbi:MAG: ATP-binding protein, partial [Armatimonadetes bacterium]|nr:ATP-binding protein [Armatimonadota bacterium]